MERSSAACVLCGLAPSKTQQNLMHNVSLVHRPHRIIYIRKARAPKMCAACHCSVAELPGASQRRQQLTPCQLHFLASSVGCQSRGQGAGAACHPAWPGRRWLGLRRSCRWVGRQEVPAAQLAGVGVCAHKGRGGCAGGREGAHVWGGGMLQDKALVSCFCLRLSRVRCGAPAAAGRAWGNK